LNNMNMRKTATSLSLRNNSKVDVQFNQYTSYPLCRTVGYAHFPLRTCSSGRYIRKIRLDESLELADNQNATPNSMRDISYDRYIIFSQPYLNLHNSNQVCMEFFKFIFGLCPSHLSMILTSVEDSTRTSI
jgi:hypothetical protein